MKKTVGIIALAALCAMGCSKSEDASVVPPPPPPPSAPPSIDMSAAAAPAAAPAAPVAPPPAPGSVPSIPAGDAEVKIADADGKPMPILDFLNMAVDNYERTRSSMTEGNIWPPITTLDQLVQVGVIRKLPAAPEGQKFVLNPETRKVTLAPN